MAGPSNWEQIKQIVASALELDLSKRPAYLDEACATNPSLRAEVESLLSVHGSPGAISDSWSPWHLIEPEPGSTTIGPYRLLRNLGQGGMGQVWLAEQTHPVRREVALKLIRAGFSDDSMLRRFHSERQSLAVMEHPAIAKVFDAGTTPEGQPYFVMEFVAGVTLTDYCDQKKLTIRERLELFKRVCEGVQHPHQKAVVHRDLKPANVLVSEVDGKPLPRIIDFGLAKSIEPNLSAESLKTMGGIFLGTPGYMSPEQIASHLGDVDTRSDVYSLGVILYELLTSCLPYDTAGWKKLAIDEIVRHLREAEPTRPSTKAKQLGQSRLTAAENRGLSSIDEFGAVLRGDLDSITMKALEKDRSRRYGTPVELASDLDRYLSSRPVLARPDNSLYRAQKYIRRNRISVAVAATFFLLLLGFAIFQGQQLRRITRERDRANRITEFMTQMFKISDPSEARGNVVTVRELLDKSARDIRTQLREDPAQKAQISRVLGTVYQSLGLYSQADSLLREAVELDRRTRGPDNPETLDVSSVFGRCLDQEGRYSEAEKYARDLILTETKVLGATHRTTLQTMDNLAWTLEAEGKLDEAETLGRQTFTLQQRNLGADDPDTLHTMRSLAWTLNSRGKYAEAEKLDREGLDIRTRVSGPENAETLLTMAELGMILGDEGRNAEGAEVLRQALEIQRRVLGASHQNTLTSMNNLGSFCSTKRNSGRPRSCTERLPM
jgi:serine/threonine protein kinase/Tfp pilus assembly protein PilF